MKTLASAIGALVLLILFGYAFNLYKRHPVDSFCKGVSAADTPQDVVARAKLSGLWVNALDENNTSVWVFNQKAPWWRYACIVEFKSDRVSGRRVILAD